MKLPKILTAVLITANVATGFGAVPSEPDFAFPKTVSRNALEQLKTALKTNDGPLTVRSLMDYWLAQGNINPDTSADMKKNFADTRKKVKNDATLAMMELVMADAEGSDSLAVEAIRRYDSALKQTPVGEWKSVIEADPVFFPTLYDFAVARTANDSVRSAAMAYDASRPYPLVYLMLQRADDYDKALDVYRRFEGKPGQAYVLARMGQYAYSVEERAQVYSLCINSNDGDAKIIAETEKYMTRPDVDITGPSVISPDSIYRLQVSSACISSLTLTVSMLRPQASVIERRTVALPGSGVFTNDTVIEFRLPKYGEYTITPSFSGMAKARRSQRIEVSVTDFMLAQQVFGDKVKRLALAGNNGRELDDVKFTVEKRQLHGSRGADRYTPSLYNERGFRDRYTGRWNNAGNLLTDRAIYHPGDSLRFAGTAMHFRRGERELERGAKINVVLYNANYQAIDTVKCTSDDFGRIHGAFLLPSEGLTGRFRLDMEGYTSQGVMVTDYKAPTFAVEVSATRLGPTEVELTGNATGYNGFPLADASVALSVTELPAWVWFRDYRNMGGGTVAADTVLTGADGTFRALLQVPAGVNLSATAVATSPAGESQDASCFLPHKRYHISAEVPEFVKAGSGPAVRVLDSKGNPAAVDCRVTLTALDDDSQQFTPADRWDNIPSGGYSLEAVAPEADTLKLERVYVYRPDDKMPPLQTSLFLPERRVLSGGRLLLGTSYPDSHIIYTLWTPDSILEQRTLTPAQGNFGVDVTLPTGIDEATITLLTLRDYRFDEQTVRVSCPDIARNLKIQVESLRDKVTPGDRETWTIRVTDNLGKPVDAAVMLDVYSKALDALQPMQWSFYAPNPFFGNNLNFYHHWLISERASASGGISAPAPLAGVRASFITYGQNWPGQFMAVYQLNRKLYGVRSMAAITETANDMELKEEAVMEDSAPMFAASMIADAAGGATTESAADEAEESGPAAPAASDEYRLPEVAVALWQPVLSTDAGGTTRIEFVAPNANTTWAVKALAYNSSLLSGVFGADIVASKPVMVQPQLPRFMRIGDRIELRAMVQNNTDSLSAVSSFIEIYNPSTDEVIDRREFADTIGPRASSVISIPFEAPAASMTAVRVRATSGAFTDGEQTIIPILPDEVTVRTGKPLFMPADSASALIEVPRGGTLTFTANAIWECVASLPGLQTSASRSALTSAGTIFSAATARGLLRQYPEIGMALRKWQDEDSVLVSRLERNDDLKLALLGSTPWEGAAQSESEQRARLLLLFNRSVTDKTISDAVKNLARLVRKGGIAWTENSDEPSQWITTRVLTTLAQLRRIGYLPADKALDKIIREAVQYLDNEVAREFAKDKNALFPAYVLMRGQFPEIRQSAPARRAAVATVQHLVGHWRDLSLPAMAEAAIILHENNYPTTARKLIESLRQHEVWRYRAICPAYLEAFHIIEPGCKEVDEIRSAYIARKHSMDWGEGPQASDLIAAIMQSGTRWLVPAANELSVAVNGRPMDVQTESVMGEFRLNLPQGADVEIRKGRFPAWGGVFSSAADSIGSVEAFASDELKLTRTVSGEMKVGAKVTVTLTLEASQAMDYVMVTLPRCAAFEPVDQLPSTLWLGYLTAYREPCPTVTNWFFNRLAKGTTTVTETFYVTASGTFALAPAEAQSQYSPEYQAHSSGESVVISE